MAQNRFFGVNVIGRTIFQVTTVHVPSVRSGYGSVRRAAIAPAWLVVIGVGNGGPHGNHPGDHPGENRLALGNTRDLVLRSLK